MRFTSDTQQLNLRITQLFISYLFSRKTILIKRYKAWAWFFKKFLMIPLNCFGMNYKFWKGDFTQTENWITLANSSMLIEFIILEE